MATKPKGRKKPTSIQDLKDLGIKPVEMERIAKAFGIQTPKAEAKTVKSDVRGRSRTAAGAKVGPKKERLRAKGEESAAPKKAAPKRTKPATRVTYRTKAKDTTKPTSTRKKYETPKDAGPEQAYRKGIVRKRSSSSKGAPARWERVAPVRGRTRKTSPKAR